ncbi:MAG: hypothetical protein H7125_05560, partial [Proteobacteria bacterium]|nr:hypothetical protein [Burkholderiales bacterium]
MHSDRRLTGFVGASLLLHAALALDWGFDTGRRPARAPSMISARLAPLAENAPIPADPLLTAQAP